LYNAIWLLFDFFFWCAIVVLAIIGLDTFALFKRITVSYAWILPALFGTISFVISAIMDIIDIIKGFTFLSLDFNYIFDCFVQPLFSVFNEFIFLVGVVLTGFWFFKCTKAKVATFKDDINEIVNVPTEEQSSEVLEDIIDETAKEVKNENFIEVTKDKINEDTVVESANINEAESVGIGDKLLRYQKMLDDGLISREDLEKLKKEIL
jgi:membrane-bound ClpP family serine protease